MVSRISGQYNLDALSRKKSRASVSYNNGSASESDNADISSFGSLLAKVNAEMKNIPEIREGLVAEISSRINSGTYVIQPDKLADRIMGMLDLIDE